MKQYFSRITADHWTAKNSLEKAAHELAYEMDRFVIPEPLVEGYLDLFKERITELDKKYCRCNPLRFSIVKDRSITDGDIYIYCDGVFQMSLFEVHNNPAFA